MGVESPKLAKTPTGAVFISYASQDAEEAQRICAALRSAGIEVWFDQSELRGGDVWDQKIRREIHECALFIPIVSQQTQERLEGYFRREWKLAIDRTHDMAEQMPFLVPVVIDGTRDQEAFVPDAFRAVQWTRLPGGETPPIFVERIKRLLSAERSLLSARSGAAPGYREPARTSRRLKPVLLAVFAVVVFAALAYPAADRFWISRHPSTSAADTTSRATAEPAAAAFAPPPHSIAVLPFVNMSGDKEQEYFSEGLTEELLNSLSRISELQVAARTSSFSFQGEHPDIATVARRLNVAAILEGSVRRSAHTIRITAQLINGVTGFHVWAQTYDRNLGDVLTLQTEIATSVAKALKVTLLEETIKKIELGGTDVPPAFDAYLRGLRTSRTSLSDEESQAAISAFTEAIALDPRFAMAFAMRSLNLTDYARFNARGPSVRATFDKALADARTAVRLAPELAEAHWALAFVLNRGFFEFAQANQEYERALALAPGDARILGSYSRNAAEWGHTTSAISAARRALILDPLNFHVHRTAGLVFLLARQYSDAITAFRKAISLQPDYPPNYALLGEAQYQQGDFEAARSSCEAALNDEMGQGCLAMVYRKLGREVDAEAMLQKVSSSIGDNTAYDVATIYAQWGDIPQALHWLEIAVRRRDSDLSELIAEPDFDPLREEPRFQVIEQELRFPK
jgi:TolB-like protein/Flp pilus assembly protein TadD